MAYPHVGGSQKGRKGSSGKAAIKPPIPDKSKSKADSKELARNTTLTGSEVNPVATEVRHVVKCVEESLKVLLLAYEIYGFEGQSYKIDHTIEHYMKLVNNVNGDWMKVLKYKLAAFFAYWTNAKERPNNPFTIKDSPGILLSGPADGWAGERLRNWSRLERHSFLQTILLAKNGMQRPGAPEMDKQVKETLAILTKKVEVKRSTNWADMTDEDYTETRLRNELVRTTSEIFENQEYTWKDRTKVFLPSTSANYINSRNAGGAIGAILESGLLQGLRSPGGTTNGKVQLTSEEEAREEGNYRLNYDDQELKTRFEILYTRLLKAAQKESNDVELVPLSEALKVRIISKGPPFRMTVLRSLQKKLASILRNFRIFRLNDIPESEDEILTGLFRKLPDDFEYISGDYKAATDNLKKWAIEIVAQTIAIRLKLGEEETKIFIDALTRHRINGIPQTEGQLMGSIVSFPVLCIINAAICRYAMEIGERKLIPLHDAAMMIHGDDLVMKTHKATRNVWKTASNCVGLTPSIGKCFYSRDYLNINSRFYLVEEHTHMVESPSGKMRDCPYRAVPHVNLGLMLGKKRSQGKTGLADQDDPRNNIGVCGTELYKSCPEWMQDKVMTNFINVHREILKKCRVPWFMPQWIGGLGLPRFGLSKVIPTSDPDFPFEYKYKFCNSDLDLRMANTILKNWDKERPIPLGIVDQPWHIRDTAMHLLPEPEYVEKEDRNTENYEKVLNLAIVDLLFDSDIKISDIHDQNKGSSKRVVHALDHNSKLWNPKGKHIQDAIAENKLKYRTKFPSLPIEIGASRAVKSSETSLTVTDDKYTPRKETPNNIGYIDPRALRTPLPPIIEEKSIVVDFGKVDRGKILPPVTYLTKKTTENKFSHHTYLKVGKKARRNLTEGGRLTLEEGLMMERLERAMDPYQ
nr:RNA-dependent RNA polymerase [Flumine narna-like virus 10]